MENDCGEGDLLNSSYPSLVKYYTEKEILILSEHISSLYFSLGLSSSVLYWAGGWGLLDTYVVPNQVFVRLYYLRAQRLR